LAILISSFWFCYTFSTFLTVRNSKKSVRSYKIDFMSWQIDSTHLREVVEFFFVILMASYPSIIGHFIH
jgi:hypothetical protein